MADFVDLSKVCVSLETASPDCPFLTRGCVTQVKRVHGSCYFALADGGARLACALLRPVAMETDFWVTVGQMVKVTGYAECFRGQWQLCLVEARLLRGDRGWPVGFRYRSARRIVDRFNRLIERLFGPPEG